MNRVCDTKYLQMQWYFRIKRQNISQQLTTENTVVSMQCTVGSLGCARRQGTYVWWSFWTVYIRRVKVSTNTSNGGEFKVQNQLRGERETWTLPSTSVWQSIRRFQPFSGYHQTFPLIHGEESAAPAFAAYIKPINAAYGIKHIDM